MNEENNQQELEDSVQAPVMSRYNNRRPGGVVMPVHAEKA